MSVAKWIIIAISGCSFFILVVLILSMIRLTIVNPIKQLTEYIQRNKRQSEVDQFLKDILSRAEKKMKRVSDIRRA